MPVLELHKLKYNIFAQHKTIKKENEIQKLTWESKLLLVGLSFEVVFRQPLYALRHCKSTHRDEIDGFPTDNKYFWLMRKTGSLQSCVTWKRLTIRHACFMQGNFEKNGRFLSDWFYKLYL